MEALNSGLIRQRQPSSIGHGQSVTRDTLRVGREAEEGASATGSDEKSLALQRDQVANPQNAKFLRSMFSRYFGVEIDIQCFTEGEERNIALEEAARKQKTPQERFRGVSDEHKPVVRKLMKEFDGEIVRFNR